MDNRDHWKCTQCNYDLHGLSGDPLRCPECGQENDIEELMISASEPPSQAKAVGWIAFLGGAVWTAVELVSNIAGRTGSAYAMLLAPVVIFVLSYAEPRGAWRWPLLLMACPFLVALGAGMLLGPRVDVGTGLVALVFTPLALGIPCASAAALRKSEWRRAALAERPPRRSSDDSRS